MINAKEALKKMHEQNLIDALENTKDEDTNIIEELKNLSELENYAPQYAYSLPEWALYFGVDPENRRIIAQNALKSLQHEKDDRKADQC